MREELAEVLLREYGAVTADADAERLLGHILEDVARPVVRQVVASACRDSGDDAEDVIADTLADLLRRLRAMREAGAPPIHDLRGYVVTSAYNRCHERLREHYPARNRLRNQLQYLCGHDARLALWRSTRGVMVCGLKEWSGREAAGGDRAANVHLRARRDPAAEDRRQLLTLVPAVFRAAGAPLDLDTLVATVARLIGLEQQRLEVPLTELEPAAETPADTALELRLSLRELWSDVRQLASKQRAALLLNLRDAHGRECLSLLPLTRTATIAEIAEAVEMPAERFAALWNELPLSDAAIAEELQVTPRQVIKLRRLARERLRRMQKTRTGRNLGPKFESSPEEPILAAGRRNARRTARIRPRKNSTANAAAPPRPRKRWPSTRTSPRATAATSRCARTWTR